MGCKSSLTVIDGGAFARVPRVLAIGAGMSGFSPSECAAVTKALELGLDILVLSSLDEEGARRAFEPLENRVTVRSDFESSIIALGLSRRAARAETLAGFMRSRDMGFGGAAVVATEPVDRDMLMAAGTAFALETAGYDAVAAAERVFPPRDAGGLVQAIDALLATIHPHGRD